MRKKLMTLAFLIAFAGGSATLLAGNKSKGEQCFNDNECEFNLQCKENVCVKKKEFDYGSSGKSGKNCLNDSDCINSGKCVTGAYGKKVCSGN